MAFVQVVNPFVQSLLVTVVERIRALVHQVQLLLQVVECSYEGNKHEGLSMNRELVDIRYFSLWPINKVSRLLHLPLVS